MQELNHLVSQSIESQGQKIAEAVLALQLQQKPELAGQYNLLGRVKCLQDIRYHLTYLANAIAVAQPVLFSHYIDWAAVLLSERGIPAPVLADNLQCMGAVLPEHVPAGGRDLVAEYIIAGLQKLAHAPMAPPSWLDSDHHLASLTQGYLDALIRGQRHVASRLILDAVQAGTRIQDIYLHVFEPTQREIGRLWQLNRLTVAQEHYCTAATQLIMSQLYPYIFTGPKNGRVFVGTGAAGELHELGIRMVTDFLELAGWDTYYIGANAPTPAIIQTLIDRRPDVLGISATTTVQAQAVAELIAAVRATAACSTVKILVGGYLFLTAPDLWRTLGADGQANSAQEVVALADSLVVGGRAIHE